MSGDDELDLWRSVPPTDDELTSIGVSVRRTVLSRAQDEPRGATRRRRLWSTGRVGGGLVAAGADAHRDSDADRLAGRAGAGRGPTLGSPAPQL